MTLHLEHGTIDPNYRLAHGDAEDMLGDAQPTAEQIEAINEAIEAFAQADPQGGSDYEARRLEERVAKILGEVEA